MAWAEADGQGTQQNLAEDVFWDLWQVPLLMAVILLWRFLAV